MPPLSYSPCRLCPRQCGVDRTAGARGICGETDRVRVARASLHLWEEPPISGTNGSGTVFFTGCPLLCVYCQNRDISHGERGHEVTGQGLVRTFHALRDAGAHNLNLVTATHFAPTVISAVRQARSEGVDLPVVWNTSGYETPELLTALDAVVDVYLTDLRYTSPVTADALSRAPDYPVVAWNALTHMVGQTGPAVLGEDGLMKRGTVVRLLLLPGHLIEAKQALHRVWSAFGDTVFLSLMSQYTPMPGMTPPLDQRVTEAEYHSFVEEASRLGVTNAFTQEREAAAESFIPPFDDTGFLVVE